MNFTRSDQLALKAKLRKHRLGKHGKALFLLLDDHIGPNPSWVLTYEELAEEAEISVNAVREAIDDLCERGVIWFEKVTDHYHERRLRFFITWANIEEMIEVPMPAIPDKLPAANPPHGGTILHRVEDSIYRKNGTLNVLSNGTPSTSADAAVIESPDETAKQVVVVKLLNCGVGRVGPTIDLALERGMSIEQMLDVIDHYSAESNSGRWSPNVLVDRLTREHMHLAKPDQGWFGENPEWTAAQKRQAQAQAQAAARQQLIEATRPVAQPPAERAGDLEVAYGAALDAMTPAGRAELCAGFAPFLRQCIARFEGEAYRSTLYRHKFLEALQQRENHD